MGWFLDNRRKCLSLIIIENNLFRSSKEKLGTLELLDMLWERLTQEELLLMEEGTMSTPAIWWLKVDQLPVQQLQLLLLQGSLILPTGCLQNSPVPVLEWVQLINQEPQLVHNINHHYLQVLIINHHHPQVHIISHHHPCLLFSNNLHQVEHQDRITQDCQDSARSRCLDMLETWEHPNLELLW